MNVAFIPVRGGSKSIPLKNIKNIAGHPLVYWTAKASCESRQVDKVYICTDSDAIRDCVNGFIANDPIFQKIEIIPRSPETATDMASTESVMLEFAEKYEFDNIALVQATSPLLLASELDEGFDKLKQPDTHSVMSVVHQYRFNWKYDENGNIIPTNYDIFHRPRRQEFDGYLVENGAFYITSKDRLLTTRNRISGNIKAVEMPPESFLEIDEPSDWHIIEGLLEQREKKTDFAQRIKGIKLFLTDVDGCLTDGGMYYSEKGDELKKFNTRDGMAFKILHEYGILTGIITSESVDLNKRRAAKLGLDIVVTGCKDKAEAIRKISKEQEISLEQICYVGDDINDIEALRMVGISCCPADAEESVKHVTNYIAKSNGGYGVIREIVNALLFKGCFECNTSVVEKDN